MLEFQKIVSPLKALFGNGDKKRDETVLEPVMPRGVILERAFPTGFHVYGFTQGPRKGPEVLVGAGDPSNANGAIFIGSGGGAEWRRVDLPDETALLNTFVRLSDGRYVAGGMSAIGRGALLLSDPSGTEWKSADLDLHPYSSIVAMIQAPDGSLIASTGQMITQGKTKPVLFRSTDNGATWLKEEQKLPITVFLSFDASKDGTLYAGTSGDHTPLMYRSKDSGRTFEALPEFPGYKTYKMLHIRMIEVNGVERLFVVLWGYKTEIADRVVRIYVSNSDFTSWEELPPIEDSHFIFSFLVTRDQTFFAGGEKGKVYRSKDHGKSWEVVTVFPTNIGAYALYEDPIGRIWIGKDYVPPSDFSLWRVE